MLCNIKGEPDRNKEKEKLSPTASRTKLKQVLLGWLTVAMCVLPATKTRTVSGGTTTKAN